MQPTTEPHGGSLMNIVVDEARALVLKKMAMELPDIALNERQLCDFELIASGAFSPLNGFLVQADYESVLGDMRLENGILWPIPICLDVSAATASNLKAGQAIAVRDPEGYLLAIMHINDIWPVDRHREAQMVYGTTDTDHPGVHYIFHGTADYYVGGRLEVISLPLHSDFKQIRLTPMEVRNIYRKLGWQRIVGFQTSQPIHRPQFEMTIRAMRKAGANLLILPVAGMTKPGDFDHYIRVRCYRKMVQHYPPDSYVLNLLPLAMRMAGPRDALLDIIVGKNYGCTHFIIGPDHASPEGTQGRSYYSMDEAGAAASRFSEELGMGILPFKQMVYLPFEDEYRFIDQVPAGTQIISMSGSDIRTRVRSGRNIPAWATFDDVAEELRKAYPPPGKQGFTVFLTGLSGAGKSTIAKILYSRFLEIGERPVSLLDGDIVRHNLSRELTFSKEHRDINVRRIGFVAGEITKNRGIAICAPIAPYAATRLEIRKNIENYGGFIEVHVATPIEECERRDRKGMYAKARAGLIKGFTGVDDPYEVPPFPEVRINTTDLTPDEAAQEILLYLGQKGYL